MDIDDLTSDTICSDESNATISSMLNSNAIKNKILNGTYKIGQKKGRSKVWNTFGHVINDAKQEMPNLVACRICCGIYKHNSKSTTNLIRHKCYLLQSNESAENTTVEVDINTKAEATKVITEWVVQNCRPYKIIEDTGVEKFAKFLVSTGAKFGPNVNIQTLLPHSTTVARSVENSYLKTFGLYLKADIATVKNIGFALTSDLWTDCYFHKSFLALTMHFIKDGKLVNVLLGMKSMDGYKCTSTNIHKKVCRILHDFECDLKENVTMVTDRGANMVAAFRGNSHIFCIAHLLNNVLKKAIEDVQVVNDLCGSATKLVRYFKKSGINSKLATSLKSFCPTRWNSYFNVLNSLKANWSDFGIAVKE